MDTNKHELFSPESSPAEKAFTLLELLVVIAVIAVLVGMSLPAIQSVLERSKKVQAKNDLIQMVTAVNAFYTEYGKYPIPSGASGDGYQCGGTTGTTAKDVLNPLRSLDPILNPRQIMFLSPPEDATQATPKGRIGSDGQFRDPWGNAYAISVDADYDNQVPNPYNPNTGAGPEKVRQGVIGWSVGKDMKLGNNGDKKFSNSDDVISWQ